MLNNDSGAYQEVGQPPLYYLIAGLVTAPIPTDDLRGLTLHNPGFGYQAPGTVNDNKNLMVHTEREAFPWRGAALAIHLARLVSLAFGALAVLAAWGLARQVFPDSGLIPLATAAIVAFTPQFVFASSVTSNDSSAAALSTCTLWAIARMMRLGVTLRRAALTGLLVGLASLDQDEHDSARRVCSGGNAHSPILSVRAPDGQSCCAKRPVCAQPDWKRACAIVVVWPLSHWTGRRLVVYPQRIAL